MEVKNVSNGVTLKNLTISEITACTSHKTVLEKNIFVYDVTQQFLLSILFRILIKKQIPLRRSEEP